MARLRRAEKDVYVRKYSVAQVSQEGFHGLHLFRKKPRSYEQSAVELQEDLHFLPDKTSTRSLSLGRRRRC